MNRGLNKIVGYKSNRRQLLAGALAGAFGGVLGKTGAAYAQELVEVLIIPTLLQGPLKGILEELADVTLNNGTYTSSSDALTKIVGPQSAIRWDVMHANSEFLAPALTGGAEKSRALDTAEIPNMSALMPAFSDLVVERDGAVHAIPHYWGYDTLLYNRDEIPEDEPLLGSWGLLFDDKYAGRIAWQDDPVNGLTIALLYLGHPEPHRATREELDDVAEFLISRKKNVRALWQTSAQQTSLLSSGEVIATLGWIPTRVALQRQGLNFASSWAKEGVVVWSVSALVPATSSMGVPAERIINALLSGEYGAALTRESGYLTTSTLVENVLSDDERETAGYNIFDSGARVYGYKYPAEINLFMETWNRVKRA